MKGCTWVAILLVVGCRERPTPEPETQPTDPAVALDARAQQLSIGLTDSILRQLPDQDVALLTRLYDTKITAMVTRERERRLAIAKKEEQVKLVVRIKEASCNPSTARAQKTVSAFPDASWDDLINLACHRIWIGMSEAQLQFSWGTPERRNNSTNASGTNSQWVYGSGYYVYLDDGVVESWQTSQ